MNRRQREYEIMDGESYGNFLRENETSFFNYLQGAEKKINFEMDQN